MLVKDRSSGAKKRSSYQLAERFKTAPLTLAIDRFMNHFIKIGGVAVIGVVIGIFIFIFAQTLPLFQGAKVTEKNVIDLPQGQYRAMGIDEWSKLPFVVADDGTINFMRVSTGEVDSSVNPLGSDRKPLSYISYIPKLEKLLYGTNDGQLLVSDIQYRKVHEGDSYTVEASVEAGDFIVLSEGAASFLDADIGQNDEMMLIGGILQNEDQTREVKLNMFTKETTLFGSGDFELEDTYDLTEEIVGVPERLLINTFADRVIIATDAGKVYSFTLDDGDVSLDQVFEPFAKEESKAIGTIDYLFGDESVVLTHENGKNVIFSKFVPQNSVKRQFGQTKNLKALSGAAEVYDASMRNKAYLITHGNTASLRYATTESVRWEKRLPFEIKQGLIGRRYKSLMFLDDSNKVHIYDLKDEHPEASFKAFFGKLWYEGYSEPSYQWQSTGGTDEFEPKLSLMPLIFGTLKGTFYALFIALPIAILAAFYVSQFADPKFKVFIKPTMEIMASVPSVVLGFLGALWLAPVLENRIPSLILVTVSVPVFALIAGSVWTSLPISYRKYLKPGREWIVLMPLLLLATKIAWDMGPVLERYLFVVDGTVQNQVIADFRLWWTHVTGLAFEQRNSVVVGLMMGFAVIPIIFTVAEDSLSNVPKSLVAGSMALGASRWQTAFNVVLPTAFPGIFSAIMIGVGRAVGETMIVVMATGNTAVMDMNIFSGMRTLSANIAVEMPEAPYLGTLYRTLFLGAVVLFLMTFVMNTFAEVVRQHIREKYKTI